MSVLPLGHQSELCFYYFTIVNFKISLSITRGATHKQLHAAMKAVADAGDKSATYTLPPGLSGFHKASVRLHVTRHACPRASG